jgi:hypothetical protein
MTKALYTDATCSAVFSMSTDKLHERVDAPFTLAARMWGSVLATGARLVPRNGSPLLSAQG